MGESSTEFLISELQLLLHDVSAQTKQTKYLKKPFTDNKNKLIKD